ncbi:MAG: SPFH domain-containing protein [Limisphaerales bacterium]
MKRSPLTLFVAFLLIAIFGLLLFVYEVRKSEAAVVLRFGKIDRVKIEPGPALRWPWPIENIYTLDQRIQSFEGKYEQFKLPDQNIIFLSLNVGFRIANPGLFMEKYKGSVPDAERQLEDVVRSAKNEVAGQHPFSDFVSTDLKQTKFDQIEEQILQKVRKEAQDRYGVDVEFIQIRKIGLPESVTANVFERMTSGRNFYTSQVQAEGQTRASEIRADADSKSQIMIQSADAYALTIQGEAEAQAMKSLAVLQQNPELATFLLQNSSLQQLLKEKTTLVLDSSSSPLQWLLMKQSEKATSTNSMSQPDGVAKNK